MEAVQIGLNYLSQVIQARLYTYFDFPKNLEIQLPVPSPVFSEIESTLTDFIRQYELKEDELLLILMALAPHVNPIFYHDFLKNLLPKSGDFPQIGGTKGKSYRGFLPTGETALFILAGDEVKRRLFAQRLFSSEHFFYKKKILWLENVPSGEPRTSGKLVLAQDYIEWFTTGQAQRPHFSMHFPAQLLETKMDWDDLVLNTKTKKDIQELERWLQFGQTLWNDWGMSQKLKPGYRVLFHGPPGTGKTLTASLLGKYTGKDVFKIDLSMVVSKFIGETEKNLANLFAKAEHKDWILFFDEADALFGKRTNVRDAHDKYANQEVSYLLQRVENYNGLVILASNFKTNIDDAFIRRFQSIVHFPLPKATERLLIWQKAFPPQVQLSDDVVLPQIAQQYELSGAEIMNVVQYCCLVALEKHTNLISLRDIIGGIQREFIKEGKIIR